MASTLRAIVRCGGTKVKAREWAVSRQQARFGRESKGFRAQKVLTFTFSNHDGLSHYSLLSMSSCPLF